jgi:predicted ATPase
MLFDVERDPYEQHDVAADRPETVATARRTLAQWREDMLRKSPQGDPLETVLEEGGPCHAKGSLRTYCKRLEETGRGWAVPELRRRHPGEFEP